MALSTLTALSPIPERSDASPGLWNSRYSTIDANFASVQSVLNSSYVTLYYPKLSVESGIALPVDYTKPWYNPYRYGAVGDNVANDGTPLQAAIEVAAPYYATVSLWTGNFRYTSALTGRQGVGINGLGGDASVLRPVNCNGINMDWNGAGFGNVVYSNFGINGTSCSTRTALANAGTSDIADTFYGLTLEKLLIQNFDVGMGFKSVRDVLIQGNWINGVNKGIVVAGLSVVFKIVNNLIVCNGGSGSTTTMTGILLTTANYAVGGLQPTEGIQILNDYIYGFHTGVNVEWSNFCNIASCDIQASRIGVEFTTAPYAFTIRDTFIDLSSATQTMRGIWGHGLGSRITSRVNILNNGIAGTGGTASWGIVLNDNPAGANQDNVRISGNLISGVINSDIQLNTGSWVVVEDNFCSSQLPTISIQITGNTPTGPIFIDRNHFRKGILYDTADWVDSGKLIFGTNTYNDTTLNYGSSIVTDGKVLAPAFRFGSEVSLGLYRSKASTIALSFGAFALPDGSNTTPSLNYTSESSLGLYRSAVSTLGMSYGAFALPAGSKTTPSLNYGSSESSLGWYRPGQATIAPSYGTIDLAPNNVRLSMRTLAASSITASAAQTNVQPNEVVFTVGGASGASLAIMSGGTLYFFNSAGSAKQT